METDALRDRKRTVEKQLESMTQQMLVLTEYCIHKLATQGLVEGEISQQRAGLLIIVAGQVILLMNAGDLGGLMKAVSGTPAFKLGAALGNGKIEVLSTEGPNKMIGTVEETKPFCQATFGKKPVNILIGTGVDVSVASKTFFKCFELQLMETLDRNPSTLVQCASASGNEFTNKSEIVFKFNIGEVFMGTHFKCFVAWLKCDHWQWFSEQ